MNKTAPSRLHPLAFASLALVAALAQAQTVPQTVEIIGTTPVPGAGVPRDQVPANVQSLSDRRLRQSQSLNLPDAMNSLLPSINVNEIQGNPYQMDVNYRGFAASPLLGTPQGLSVFQDGVRINEAFGDVVNWDLVPRAALANLTLLPGSNPVFGLNTLGGALTLQTKSGDTHEGTEVELQGGSFKRFSGELTHGLKLGQGGHLFLAASSFREDGWRDFSPSRVNQLFVKAGHRGRGHDWALSLTHANNRLVGNGLLPEDMLAADRSQVYTRPDQTTNKLTMLSFNGGLDLSPTHRVSATAYTRRSDARTVNGDLNDEYEPPDVTESGVENRSQTRQRGEGLALQSLHRFGAQQLTLGLSIDRSRSRFAQTEAEGDLDETRAVEVEEEEETNALISGRSRTTSLYLHDVVTLHPSVQLTLSGRYNDTRVSTLDEGRATLGLDTRLDAEGRYRKFNPAVGLTWQASPALTLYGNLSQGNRAPSPIELGCSDPEQPCVLPNALQSDPPLRQVVSRTFEAGARGTAGSLRWNATAFRTMNKDDLLFISNGLAAGYFTNFGRTQRQGLELGVSQQLGGVSWSMNYSLLQATYRSSACLTAEGNSTAETSSACSGDDEIEVRPGDRLPGLPQHSLKMSLDWRAGGDLSFGAQLRAFSSQFVRGNENNRHRSGTNEEGDEFSGSGRIAGFAVLDLTATWKIGGHADLFAKVSNVLNRRYGSAGLLGESAFDARGHLQEPDEWRQAQFVGPGAPRAVWVGARLSF